MKSITFSVPRVDYEQPFFTADFESMLRKSIEEMARVIDEAVREELNSTIQVAEKPEMTFEFERLVGQIRSIADRPLPPPDLPPPLEGEPPDFIPGLLVNPFAPNPEMDARAKKERYGR